MANPIASSQFVRLLDNQLTEVSKNKFNSLPSQLETFYKMFPSDSAFEEFYDVGSLGDIPEFTGEIEYLPIYPGYYKKIEPKEFAGGIEFERKLLDDEKYGVFTNRAELLAESAKRVREKYGVRPFAYAFSTAYDFQTSEEGVALCSSSHTTKSGTSTASGFSNAGTSALSRTSVAATRLLMRKFKNDISERISINPDMLIVPDNLYDKAMEIVGSDKDPESANNTINMNKGRFKVVPYMMLDDYDSNNWYMVDSSLMKRFLIWIDRIKYDVANNIDFQTKLIQHSVYFRIGCGFTDWRFIFGQNVT